VGVHTCAPCRYPRPRRPRDPTLVHVYDSTILATIIVPPPLYKLPLQWGTRPLPPALPLSPETIVAPSSASPFCPPHKHGHRPSP
jgi:hypothetical protein